MYFCVLLCVLWTIKGFWFMAVELWEQGKYLARRHEGKTGISEWRRLHRIHSLTHVLSSCPSRPSWWSVFLRILVVKKVLHWDVQNEGERCPEWGKQLKIENWKLKVESGKLKIIKRGIMKTGIFTTEDTECTETQIIESWKLKMENIVVHKTLKRAQNKNQQSADNCAGQSYPLTAMSFFINFMFFMVKCISKCPLCSSCEKWSRNDGMVLHRTVQIVQNVCPALRVARMREG